MSYLQNWFSPGTAPPPSSSGSDQKNKRTIPGSFVAEEELDDGSETETENDVPPAFPSLSSAQRASAPAPANDAKIPTVLSDSMLMPPPPIPAPANATSSGLRSSTRVASSSLLAPMATTQRPPKPSKKVALAPGFGPLDWAKLKSSGEDLRGVDTLLRVPPSVLKSHNKKQDAWTAINGKVYNITPYLPYHPGGEKELMRVAGRDGTKLFSLTHAWVNVDFMLDSCLVGFLVPEPSS
ncbi:cytochrome b5-like heme/steroid binding domain-containing protein [Pisolithus thermaeus]|nr:cytochrome b5-like heme/steroid binding domain-containing protein [Pisolithus croceorrhizus]KAI6165780.1 cytochrome b5-like heme/steroid binding domain-containing protein [Pisolithus thermaeus]